MTEAEALTVVGVLLAGFPNAAWGDTTIAIAVGELRPLGAVESMAAARAVIRNHQFLTFAAFFTELAHVREQFHDEHRSDVTGCDLTRPALPPVPERWTLKAEAKTHVAHIRAQLLAMTGPLARSLSRVSRPIVTLPRADESYFHPPAPEPAPEPPGEVL